MVIGSCACTTGGDTLKRAHTRMLPSGKLPPDLTIGTTRLVLNVNESAGRCTPSNGRTEIGQSLNGNRRGLSYLSAMLVALLLLVFVFVLFVLLVLLLLLCEVVCSFALVHSSAALFLSGMFVLGCVCWCVVI